MVRHAGAAAMFKSRVACAAGFSEVLKIIANLRRVAFMNHQGSIFKNYMPISVGKKNPICN